MSKELVIVFLYDCELIKGEEDDPHEAIIYFYPTWVNSEQRHALCSQLMGVTQFCSSLFSVPKLISLQSGKFAIKKMGRFALCVGTDRNIPDMVLNTRSDILCRLLKLFHYNVESLQASLLEDDDSLTDRFTQLLQVYLPILQYATNTFGNITTLKIPKSTSTIYLEAIQTLQSFQNIDGVLGGTLLYHNKVIASQLNHSLTKQLVVTDPYRIKEQNISLLCEAGGRKKQDIAAAFNIPLPAQNVTTPFHLPIGVQLLMIYVDSREAKRLRDEVIELHMALNEIKNWRKENEAFANNKAGKGTKEGVASGMKRDMSRIFTVPEEPSEAEQADVPDLVKDAVRARQLSRIDMIVPANFVITNPNVERHSWTTDDLTKKRNIPIRYYSLGLPPLGSTIDSPDEKKSEKSPSKLIRPFYNTICDPNYPLFKPDGLPASYSLYKSRLTGHYESLKSIEDTKKEITDAPLMAPCGIPLTPLMAKLSILAQEESQLETPVSLKPLKGFRNTVKTPAFESSNSFTPINLELKEEKEKAPLENQCDKKLNNEEDDLVQLVLYVFGHNNTSILLLIENSVSTDPEKIHSLWERSITSLKRLEERLHKCLDHLPMDSSGEYSFAVVDPDWGPIERGGAYQPHQLELLTAIHYTLSQTPTITDILVRGEDTISYGYQCGKTQIFYQQNCTANAGVPTPADLMGVIPTKAKRTLERDHGIMLL